MPIVKITIKPVDSPTASPSSSQNIPVSPRGSSPARAARDEVKAKVEISTTTYDTCLYLKEGQVKSLVSISTLLLTLEALIANAAVSVAERKEWQNNAWQLNMHLPGGLYNQQWMVARNESARKALFKNSADYTGMTQLAIDDMTEPYAPLLEGVPQPLEMDITDKLSSLQLSVGAHSEHILQSLNLALIKKTLPQLSRLELLFAENEQACSYVDDRVQLKQEWSKIPEALRDLYQQGLANLPEKLKHLGMIFLLRPTAQSGLALLSKHLPQLETLKVAFEQPAMQLQQKRGRAFSSSPKPFVLQRTESVMLVDKSASSSAIKSFSPDFPVQRTLKDILKEHPKNRLARFEMYEQSINIYKGREENTPVIFSPQFLVDLLTECIEEGLLPELKDLVIGSTTSAFYENLYHSEGLEKMGLEINWQEINTTIIDTTQLLNEVIKRKLSLKNVEFYAPEKGGYKSWFAYILNQKKENIFNQLEYIYYRIPVVFHNWGHLEDVINVHSALADLYTIISKGYLPALKSVVIDDPMKIGDQDIIKKIEKCIKPGTGIVIAPKTHMRSRANNFW